MGIFPAYRGYCRKGRFSGYGTFPRVFKKYTGLSANEFRNQMKSEENSEKE